tara:strand:- start:413 stop:1183 length:771 start_codon:yes stop_codon:yes gene_type:complete
MNFDLEINEHRCIVTLKDTSGTNLITEEFCGLLEESVNNHKWDPNIRVWVIKSATAGIFATQRQTILGNHDLTLHQLHEKLEKLQVSRIIKHIPVPVVVIIDGEVSDHGLEFMLAADVKISSDISSFSISVTNTNFPWDNGIPELINNVGRTIAADMLYTGRTLTASEALRVGLLTTVTTKQELANASEHLLSQLTSMSPNSMKFIKESITAGISLPLSHGLGLEGDLSVLLQSTADRMEGLRSFFNKQTPNFSGQ